VLSAQAYGDQQVALCVAASNRERVGAEVGGNVLVPRACEACSRDTDGNLVRDGRWLYSWDAENRLVRVMSWGSVDRRRVDWTYDALGRLVRQVRYVWTNRTKRTEDCTGLVLYEYRAYSSGLARRLGRDSIEEQGGANLVAFCVIQAVGATDYLGMQGAPPGWPRAGPRSPPFPPPQPPRPQPPQAHYAEGCAFWRREINDSDQKFIEVLCTPVINRAWRSPYKCSVLQVCAGGPDGFALPVGLWVQWGRSHEA
jgi:RHS repeat-associated protein